MQTFHKYGLYTALLATLMAMLCVTSCGIKPRKLAQPPGSEKNDFPRKYPMPENGF